MLRLLALLLLATATLAPAAVFQYRLPIPTKKGEADAFLWLPAEAPRVRGVVVAGMTLMEREMAKDPLIRAACTEVGLAICFTRVGLGGVDVPALLATFATQAGRPELAEAPLCFVGHSAGGPQARAKAITHAERCFGLVQYRGGGPMGEPTMPPGIPCLMMVGQFDEFGGAMRTGDGAEPAWQRARDGLAAWRAADPRNLGSLVVEPGAGHFAWSSRNAEYLALWLREVAAARLPAEPPEAGEVPQLTLLDPAAGWLSDLTGTVPPGPVSDFAGDARHSAWHCSEDLARATVAFHQGLAGRKDQFIRWQDGHWVDAGTRYFFTGLQWVGDGDAFETHPVYADTVPAPGKDGQGPRWPNPGEPVGHSDAPITVRQVSGPVRAIGPTTLQMWYDALAPATEAARVTFMAVSAGDAEYRHTEQVGMMPRGFKGLNKGRAQTITFPELPDLVVGGDPLPLQATSDAGLPVRYHLAWGPAVIDEQGGLAIAELPVGAPLPIAVRVVAWQFGSGVEPLVQTATPVVRDLHIVAAAAP